MVYVFFASVILFTGLMILTRFELVRGVRIGGNVRRRIDRRLIHWLRVLQYTGRFVVDFLNRDVLIKSLHIASYVALLLVRYTERRLVQLTVFFRSFRKRKSDTRRSILHSITREKDRER
ncbi:MAG: hypothetical protein KBD24_00480 [Candidatus Pacebacteria bacterium]|nr:hypothetical protein [Candidatus Paceibacterota bacterium]